MRVLDGTHRFVHQLGFTWDSGTLFGITHGGSRWDERVVDRWSLAEEGPPQPVDCAVVQPAQFTVLPDGRLAVGGHAGSRREYAATLAIIDPMDAGAARYLPPGSSNTVAVVAPTGDRVLVLGAGRGAGECIVSYRLPFAAEFAAEWTVKITHQKGPDNYLASVTLAFGQTGQRFLALENTWANELGMLTVARWRSAATGKPLGKPIPVEGDFSSASRFVVAGTRLVHFLNAALSSYDLTTPGAPPTKASGSRKRITGIAVHPDGRRVFATSNDESVREYDAVTLRELRAYAWKVGKLRCVAVAPDGLTAAAGSDTGTVVIWDLE